MTAPNPLRGVAFFTLGVLLFACMDTSAKYLVSRYDVPVVVAARYIGNLLLMSALLAPRYGKEMVQTQRTGLVVIRALCLAASSLLVGLALQRMPVAETTAISFLAPMLVVLVSGPLLGERAGLVGWTAALAGFAGVLLIARPGSGLDPWGIGFALLGVSVNAGYQLLSRVLVASERTMALLFYTALVGSIIFGLAAPWFLDGRVPTAFEALLFCSLGAYGGLGHFLITAAYRDAPASLLAPVNYLQLLWAGLLGWIVFRHVPDALSLLGMAIIAASGIAVAIHSRRPLVKRSV